MTAPPRPADADPTGAHPAPATADGAWAAVLGELAAAGITTLFGLPADDVAVLRALAGAPGTDMVVCRDQRAAGYMALGHAQAGGGVGVVVVGKGPAVTTVSSAVLEAATSRTPLLVIAAGTPGAHRHTGAFQELDQMAVLAPLVRRALRAETAARLVPTLRQALWAATGPIAGPVYLEVPDDLLDVPVPLPATRAPLERAASGEAPADGAASALVAAARRPVVLAGGGARGAAREVAALAAALDAPVFLTASGRGGVDETDPHVCGLSGLYAHPEVAPLWAEADLVIALGSRLEETATFGWAPEVGASVPVVQVNTAAAELSAEFGGPAVLGDAGAVARGWAALAGPGGPDGPDRSPWRARWEGCRRRALTVSSAPDEHDPDRAPRVRDALGALRELTPDDRVLVAENGLADMWTYHWPAYVCRGGGGWVAPSEQTPLGFGVAAAAGVKRAVGERCVVAVVGDGAFTLVDADLPTLADAALAVLYVVVDNGGYGWLESQRRPGDGIAAGTFARPRTADPVLADPRVSLSVVSRAGQVAPAIARAHRATGEGRPAVVWLRVGLDDGPHAGAELDGEFPQA